MTTATSSAALDHWVARPVPRPDAPFRLFCLPFAGGGTLLYRGWPYELSENIEVCAIQLPGREGRLKEEPYTCLRELVSDLADVLSPLLDRPYAFFGHSMGGLIAFELTRELIARGESAPQHLFVSGRRAAHIEDQDLLHSLDDDEFTQALRRFNGLSERLFKNERLMRFFLPTLRADFHLFETHSHQESAPLPCSITAFGGEDDAEATTEQLAAWEEHTAADFSLHTYPGDHFFLRQHQSEMLLTIAEDIHRVRPQTSTSLPFGGMFDTAYTPSAMLEAH